jgi:2-dehydro-3-deoxyphosphogluconate aldolase / (4S)-4-hydroxy-2-oxoglutarate aldolase
MDAVVEPHTHIIDRLAAVGIVPIVEIPNAEIADPLAEALLEAELPCLEVTLRTPAAEAALERLASNYGSQLLLGAGTVLTPEHAERAAAVGATFLVSPGVDPGVVAHAQSLEIPIIPGICTPSEMSVACRAGIAVMKFFPAVEAGGISYLDAISAPFRDVRFIPTGGIGPANLPEYLAHPRVVACGGSWIANPALLRARDFRQVRQLAADAIACVKLVRDQARESATRLAAQAP